MAKSAFGSAKRVAPGTTKPKSNVLVAGDVQGDDGVLFTADQVKDSIKYVAAASVLEDKAKALKETNRPPVLAFAKQELVNRWIEEGKRPDSPKIHTDPNGNGKVMTVIFQDRECKLEEFQFQALANLIGAEEAEKWTVKRDEFAINPEILERRVKIGDREDTVFAFLDEAIATTFDGHDDITTQLIIAKPVFKTKKGLLDQALNFFGKAKAGLSQKMMEFLDVARVVVQMKPGAVGNVEINGLDAYGDDELIAELKARGFDPEQVEKLAATKRSPAAA